MYKREDVVSRLKTILENEINLNAPGIRIDGMVSRQWTAFNLLLYFCDVEEFVAMTESPIAAYRTYGYYGLVYHNNQNITSIHSVTQISTVNTFLESTDGRNLVNSSVINCNHWFNKTEIDEFLEEIRNNETYRNQIIQEVLESHTD